MRNFAFILLCSLFLSFGFSLFAQESEPKRFTITGAYAMLGKRNRAFGLTNDVNFYKLGLGSDILNNGFQLFQGENNMNSYYGPSIYSREPYMFIAGVELKPNRRKSEKLQHQIRIGIQFNGINTSAYSYFSSNEFLGRSGIDTIVYSAKGDTNFVYFDSLQTRSIILNYSNSLLCLDFSYIFRLYPENTFSLYGGIGLSPGIIFNARTRIESQLSNPYRQSHSLNQSTTYNPYNYYDINYYNRTTYSTEIIRNKPGYACDIYIPIGLNLRLGSKNEFWKRVNIFYEIRPTLSLQNTPENGGSSRASILRNLGLRATF